MQIRGLQLFILTYLCLVSGVLYSQISFYEPINFDTVSWQSTDFGKMWTFDNVPVSKFEKLYGFKPSKEWLDDVQKSALQFGNGCSAAFVSEDGLIMTNHHCARGRLASIQKDGEDLLKDGFYAESLSDERKIENLYVDQLILIEDVTSEIKEYLSDGKDEEEIVKLREEIKAKIIDRYSINSELIYKIVTLYHGGKYSLYGYKRYNDIRLVMAPDFQIAATGWDWDNFTYPRYELDFMFFRAYDDIGDPIKSDNFFRWSKKGANSNEPVFVVGRPGSTDRLYSYAQLKYLRDFAYPNALIGYNKMYEAYFDYYKNHPEKEALLNDVMRWGNARKSYAGRLAGLKNEYIMKKKIDFQNDLINNVKSDPILNADFGHLWDEMEIVVKELSEYSAQNSVVRFNRTLKPVYYKVAEDLIKLARQQLLEDSLRETAYQANSIDETIENIFPLNIDIELQENLLKASVDFLTSILNKNDPIIVQELQSHKPIDAIKNIKSQSQLFTKRGALKIAKMDPQEILASPDPLIKLQLKISQLSDSISPKVKELNNKLSVLNEKLGEVISFIYKDEIPPDATSTLRISDGVIKGYEYNGTLAPGKTTYYGLWDRYESFNKKTYPWGLHERWRTPPEYLDLSTDIGFASTNDIVGGNSGSSVINVNREVVGLVHDGNIESLAGHTIFLEENNRTVATDSDGLLQALIHIYKTERLVDELIKGKRD